MTMSIEELQPLMIKAIVERKISGEQFYEEVEARGGYEPWNEHMLLTESSSISEDVCVRTRNSGLGGLGR